jgi:hypothetical protein
LRKVQSKHLKFQQVDVSIETNLGFAKRHNRAFFRNSPVIVPPTGKITITGGVASGLYSNLSTAIAYINTFTSATVTDATLVGDVFKFTVPANSDFSNASDFLIAVSANIQDPDGLITKFGDTAFHLNTGNNLLVNVEFGNDAFNSATGTNTITNILLTNQMDLFALDYKGIMNILGNVGTTEASNYPSFFLSAGSATINAKVAKQTSNGSGVEGDLDNAMANGATVLFNL